MTTKERSALIRKVERRTRAKYVRRCWLCFLLALIIGLAGGIYLCKWGPLKSFADPTRSGNLNATVTPAPEAVEEIGQPEATEEAAAETALTPTPVAEVTATPAPVAVVTVMPVATKAPEATEAAEPTEAAEAEGTEAVEAEATPLTIIAAEVSQAPVNEQPAAAADAGTPEEDAAEPATDAAETDATEPAETDAAEAEADETDAAEAGLTETEAAATDATEAEVTEVDAEEGVLDAQEAAAALTLGTLENPVPMGEAYNFETEVVQGGTPRYAVSMAEYDTLSVSASVNDYLTPDYFAEKYSTKYKLQGNEAGAALQLNFAETTGVEEINPQDALLINFESEDGTTSQGYQLMNAEIAGDYGVPLKVGEEKTYYKRFAYTTDPEMDYLTLTYYVGGQAVKVYFSLEAPVEEEPAETPAPTEAAPEVSAEATPEPEQTPAEAYVTIENGSRGDHVKKLQERLIELGYLDDVADGISGGNTASAISAAQTKAGMTVNGIADSAFQEYIFSDDAQKAGD